MKHIFPSDGASGANTVCDEAKDTGPCTNFVTKWYYNKVIENLSKITRN